MSKSLKNKEILVEDENKASFEDQVWLFWEKYNRHIILGIVLLVFGYIGYYGVGIYHERQLDKLQEEYREALTGDRTLIFAENNKKEPLAGFVFLKAGDDAFKNKDYTAALKYYQDALKTLKNTLVASRIELSIAMMKYDNGEKDSAIKTLENLTKDSNAMNIVKAGAAYQLTLITLEQGNFAQSKQYLELLINIPNGGVWTEKGLILKNTTPELANN